MELKEYKPIAFKNLNEPDNPAPTGGEERPVDSSKDSSNNTYIVAQGDTLWAISKKFYGKGSDYTKIYDANKDLIGPNPNLIKPGQELVIPQ
jgi:nucleoid-associated protein YgaU